MKFYNTIFVDADVILVNFWKPLKTNLVYALTFSNPITLLRKFQSTYFSCFRTHVEHIFRAHGTCERRSWKKHETQRNIKELINESMSFPVHDYDNVILTWHTP